MPCRSLNSGTTSGSGRYLFRAQAKVMPPLIKAGYSRIGMKIVC